MGKEKALKNQGSKFREDIVIEGEKGGEVRYDEEKDSVLDAVT